MITQMVRSRKFCVAVLTLGLFGIAFASNHAEKLKLLKIWLPLMGLFALQHYFPNDRIKTLRPAYKALIMAAGIGLIVWGCNNLYHLL